MRPNPRDFRRRRNYLLALASEAAGPALRFIANNRCGPPTPKASWRKGLLVSHTHIGDVLYRTASLSHLRAALPNCEWHYLTSPESDPVLKGNPDVARTHPLVRGENSWTLRAGGFSELREERYDVILCSNSVRHYPDLALAVALGIPNRVGYAHRGCSALITHPIAVTYPQPYPAYFRDMVGQLCGIATGWELKPRIEIAAADHHAADRFLDRFQKDGSPLMACCPFARQEQGTWPERFFIEPINTLAGNIPVRILFCGSKNQKAELEAIANAIGAPTMVLAGDLSLTTFAALLSRCNLVFSQDSGPRHLANAVGTPVVFLRNLWFLPEEAGAYCETETDAAPIVPLLKESEYAPLQRSLSTASLAELLREKLAYSK